MQEALGGRLVPMGSAGAKAMAVVLGEADVYAHAGGQYEWDNAAPAAVAAAAGLHVSRLDGSPLRYNQRRPVAPRPADLPPRPRRAGAQGAERLTPAQASQAPCGAALVRSGRSPPRSKRGSSCGWPNR